MSIKTRCPGCESCSSNVTAAFAGDRGCPNCGLSTAAAMEIFGVQARIGDKRLIDDLVAALRRADIAERDRDLARKRLALVGRVLEGEFDSFE